MKYVRDRSVRISVIACAGVVAAASVVWPRLPWLWVGLLAVVGGGLVLSVIDVQRGARR